MKFWDGVASIGTIFVMALVGWQVMQSLEQQDDYRNQLLMNCTNELNSQIDLCQRCDYLIFNDWVQYCADAKLLRSTTQNTYEQSAWKPIFVPVILGIALIVVFFIGLELPPLQPGEK